MSFAVLEFKTEYRNRKNDKGEDVTVPVDMVLLAPRGEGFDRTQTWHRIKDLMPKEGMEGDTGAAARGRWDIIEPRYKAYKEGEEVVEDGTPLGAWAAIDQNKAQYLRSMGIHTVEHVADMSSADVQKLPFPNRIELPKLAKTFLDNKDKSALAEQNAHLMERIAAMEEMLQAQMEDKPKPKRGRPPKVKTEGEAA